MPSTARVGLLCVLCQETFRCLNSCQESCPLFVKGPPDNCSSFHPQTKEAVQSSLTLLELGAPRQHILSLYLRGRTEVLHML